MLEMLGIHGNPLNEALRNEIAEKGTKSLVNTLLEAAPGKSYLLTVQNLAQGGSADACV